MNAIINTATELVPVGKLRAHPKNPRQGDIGAIAASIEANGFYGVIVAQKATGRILAGNHRWQAAKQLGIREIPVAYVDVDDQVALRILLADNRTNDLAAYDDAALADLLAKIIEDTGTLAGTGYDGDDLDSLLRDIQDTTPGDITEDNPPLPPLEPTTEMGDVWELGRHRLLCGDATEPASYDKLLGNKTVDLLLTDPPYNVAYVGGTGLTIQNDKHATPEAFERFLTAGFTSAAAKMRKGAPAYIFHADTYGVSFRQAFAAAGLELKQVLVWVKHAFAMGRQDYQWKHEPILYGWKLGAAHTWKGQFDKDTVLDDAFEPSKLTKPELLDLVERAIAESTVIREDRPSRNAEHPTMKPVRLCARLIDNSSSHNATVLDPFAGSGSTLIACEHLSRNCYAIELDPAYCDVIVERWGNLTGKTATKTGS